MKTVDPQHLPRPKVIRERYETVRRSRLHSNVLSDPIRLRANIHPRPPRSPPKALLAMPIALRMEAAIYRFPEIHTTPHINVIRLVGESPAMYLHVDACVMPTDTSHNAMQSNVCTLVGRRIIRLSILHAKQVLTTIDSRKKGATIRIGMCTSFFFEAIGKGNSVCNLDAR